MTDLRSRLNRFAKIFQCDVHDSASAGAGLLVCPEAVCSKHQQFSDGHLKFIFARPAARSRAKSFDPLAGIPWANEIDREVGIYSPDELKSIIESARPGMLAYVCRAAFAGLRQAELARLDWTMVKADHIVVGGEISKPGVKRQVSILPNLAAWLEPLRCDSGPVVPYKNISNEVGDLVRKAEVTRQTNGLRHSFGTHRLALLKNPDAVHSIWATPGRNQNRRLFTAKIRGRVAGVIGSRDCHLRQSAQSAVKNLCVPCALSRRWFHAFRG